MSKEYTIMGYKVRNDGYRLYVTLPNGEETIGAEYKYDDHIFGRLMEELLENYHPQ